MERVIRLEIDVSSWVDRGRRCPPALARLNGAAVVIDILELLLFTAITSMPPKVTGMELALFWPWLRYLPALEPGMQLRLRKEWDDLDSHQKTLLSDDFGVGFGALIACRVLGLSSAPLHTKWFVNTIRAHGQNWIKLNNPTRRGPTKTPDFVGLSFDAGWPQIHVIECKGTQDSNYLKKQLRQGRIQKSTVSINPSLEGERIVSGLYIARADATEPSVGRIVDPPPDIVAETANYDSEVIRKVALQGHLAAVLHLLGWSSMGNYISNVESDLSLGIDKEPPSLTSLGNGYMGVERIFNVPDMLEPEFSSVLLSIGIQEDLYQTLRSSSKGLTFLLDQAREIAASMEWKPKFTTLGIQPLPHSFDNTIRRNENSHCIMEFPAGTRLEMRLLR